MNKKELIEKITEKKEFSKIPESIISSAMKRYPSLEYTNEETIKQTRKFLGENFSYFLSKKLLVERDRNFLWVLKKHKSTRERIDYYDKIYFQIKKSFPFKEISIFDLGSGVNGFSLPFLKKYFSKIKYFGIEAVGQLVELTNKYFKKNFPKEQYISVNKDIFDIKYIEKLILSEKNKKIIFLFKVIDSLESRELNYSKKFLKKLTLLVDGVVLSFATHSLGKRSKLFAKRKWLFDFISKNFTILDDFSFFGERYLIFKKK